ncbi:hypothetical protein WJ438_37665 [Streptomyces sp. GD-15H]|uniref:hypothetical protein n=1 Tax=Streptomyces sp. GD-15H TaxID=3129112 RepID=UPI00324FBBC7
MDAGNGPRLRFRVQWLPEEPDSPRPPVSQVTTLDVPVTAEHLGELVHAVYQVGGGELVDAVVAQPDSAPALWDPDSDTLAQARRYCAEAVDGVKEEALEALEEVDWHARLVLSELTEHLYRQTRLAQYGLVEMPLGAAVKPPIAWRDWLGPERYRRFRRTVLDLDKAARSFRSAGKYLVGTDRLPPPTRILGDAGKDWRAARSTFVAAWRTAVERFPALAVCGAQLLADCADRFTDDDMHEVKKQTEGSFDKPFDHLIQSAVVEAWRGVREHSSDVVDEIFEQADEAQEKARRVRETPTLFEPAAWPEQVYGERNPLWRYPFVIAAALERCGAEPGSRAYAAATAALEAAAKAAAAEQRESELIDSALGWASLGFGVLAFVPVIGLAAGVAAMALSAGSAIVGVHRYRRQRAKYLAFGPMAPDLGVEDPAGAGLLLSAVESTYGALPVVGPLGRAGGRLLRLAALESRVTTFVVDTVAAQLETEAIAALIERELRKAKAYEMPDDDDEENT